MAIYHIVLVYCLLLMNYYTQGSDISGVTGRESLPWHQKNLTLVLSEDATFYTDPEYFQILCSGTDEADSKCEVHVWDFFSRQVVQRCMLNKFSEVLKADYLVDLNSSRFRYVMKSENYNDDGKYAVVSMKRLGENKALIELHKLKNNRLNRHLVVFIVNTVDCSVDYSKFILEGYSNGVDIAFLGKVVVYDDATYDIIISNRRQCKDVYTTIRTAHIEKCIIHYSGESRSLGRPKPFDTILDGMVIDPVGRNLFIRGYDPELEKEIIVYRMTDNMKRNVLIDEPAIETISWSDSEEYVYCRIINRGKSSTVINCALFDDDAFMILNTTIEYPGAVKLLKTTRSGREGIYLVAEMINCVGNECWTLLFTQIEKDKSETLEYPCKCSGETSSISFRGNRFYSNFLSYICIRNADNEDSKSYVSYEVIDWNYIIIPKMTLKSVSNMFV